MSGEFKIKSLAKSGRNQCAGMLLDRNFDDNKKIQHRKNDMKFPLALKFGLGLFLMHWATL